MIEAIYEELREAVRKHLPSAIGEELQQLLKQAERDAKALLEVRADVARQEKVVDGHLKTIADLRGQLEKHKALDEREQEIDKRERDQLVYELKADLKASEGSRDFARNVALGLVRNTDFREVVHHTTNVPVPVTQNGFTNVVHHPSTDRNEVTKTAT